MNKAKLMMALTSLVSLILASGAYFRSRSPPPVARGGGSPPGATCTSFRWRQL